ncbi:hypothetical protein P389DRAFT_207796 [Cystobasidium minutum MCA 4210]|uniref:uncharacterized protein n=1 Tax=Cystobasidium minutum MCA 4210 TaxID=1397322 RepID=UPI0034CEF9F1|eukprot:jgi/Rhomi1/207796/estExt_Genemark1.C_1_t20258
MNDNGPSSSAVVAASIGEALSPSTSMTSSTTRASLPAPDKVLFDPATILRPHSPTAPQTHRSLPSASSVFAAGPSKFSSSSSTNRPVKRSTSTGSLHDPPTSSHTEAAAIPRKSLTTRICSPPPLAKSTLSKRVFEAPPSAAEERPSKRTNSAYLSSETSPASSSFVTSAVPSKSRLPVKGKISAVPQTGSIFSRAFATTKPNKDRTDAKLFAPPSVARHDTLRNPATSTADSQAVPAGSSSVKLGRAGPALLPSLPVKFEPSSKGHFNFDFTRTTSNTFRSSLGNVCIPERPSLALAPSPIRADEHVPRPLPHPILSQSLRSPSSTSINSLNASPSRLQAPFRNPFLGFQHGRAQVSSTANAHVPSSPPASPVQTFDISGQHQSGHTVSPARTSLNPSATNPRPGSPMQRDDLMRRTLERNGPARDAVLRLSPLHNGNYVAPARQTDLTTQSHPEPTSSSIQMPCKEAAEHRQSPAQKLHPHQLPLPLIQPELSPSPSSSSIKAHPGSPYKGPASPLQANDQDMTEDRRIRQRKEDATSETIQASSRRQSMRQASRHSDVKQISQPVSRASDFSKPRARPKSRQSSSEPEGALQYRPASAGGSAPITRPIASRSISAPVATMTRKSEDHADVFKAPVLSASVPVRSRPAGDTTMDEGNSNDNLDADTSIMSTSGLSSLANLQSLLSKMSRPSVSRRTSMAFSQSSSSLSRLSEQAENDDTCAKDPQAGSSRASNPSNRHIAGLPRYAAPTSSSNARQSKGLNGPSSTDPLPQDNTTAKHDKPRKRPSNAPSEVRRGSLLPMAVNAAQRLTVRPDGPSTAGKQDVPTLKVSKVEKCQVLKDVVAFVDVKTAEGDEAGGVFVDILRSLGARVLARPTDSITHIIFKGGRPATVQRYRAYTKEPKPFFIGVGWVVRCRETNEKADESAFLVNPDTVDNAVLLNGPGVGQKRAMQPLAVSSGNVAKGLGSRRQSLEPKVLFPDPSKRITGAPKGQLTLHSFNVFGKVDGDQEGPNKQCEIERARQRSLKFAPRIGSPLKQRVYNAMEHDEELMQED